MTARAPTSLEDAVWTAALRLGEFRTQRLATESGVSLSTVQRHLSRWLDQGQVTRQGVAGGAIWRVSERTEPCVEPRQQSPEGNMWRAMRHIGAFTALDLALHATTDELGVSEAEATRYIRALLPAGYLRVLRTASPPRRPAVYRLVRNTGPLPPRLHRVSAVWDANKDCWSHFPEAPR